MSLQFSDTTNQLGIIQEMETMLGVGKAGVSGNTQLLNESVRHVNGVMSELWHVIFMAYGGWHYDDSNQTDLPAATDAITADQTSYALPTSALSVRGVEVKDEGNNWHKLTPITEEQIRERQAEGEFHDTSGRPHYYRLVGDSVKIYPASNYTQASSFKVFFDRGSVYFDNADTTETPGFAGEYHYLVPLGASYNRLRIDEPSSPKTSLVKQDYLEGKNNLREFYQNRWSNMKPNRFKVFDSLTQSM